MFVAGWRHALRSEWPFIIIIVVEHACAHPLGIVPPYKGMVLFFVRFIVAESPCYKAAVSQAGRSVQPGCLTGLRQLEGGSPGPAYL